MKITLQIFDLLFGVLKCSISSTKQSENFRIDFKPQMMNIKFSSWILTYDATFLQFLCHDCVKDPEALYEVYPFLQIPTTILFLPPATIKEMVFHFIL